METFEETENPEAASSQASQDGASGAPADSSTKPEGAPATERDDAGSSAANAEADKSKDQAAKGPKNLSAALDEVKLEEPDDQPEGKPAEGKPEGEGADSATKPNAENAGGQGAKDESAKDKSADSADVPFQQRPEWKQLHALTGDKFAQVKPILRQMMTRETHLTQKVRELEPSRKLEQELRTHTGNTEQGMQGLRGIVKAYATEPDKAVPILRQMLADAEQRAGMVVVSDDLKARAAEIDQQVTDGLMDKAQGEKLKQTIVETERARAGRKQAEARLQQTESERQQREASAASQAVEGALNRWEDNIRERDPDFGEVTELDDPKHGESVADQVFDAICLKAQRAAAAGRALTQDDVIAEAKRVYGLARGRLPQPAGREQRVVTSTRSSVTAKPASPRNVREAMDNVKLE